MSVVNCPPPDDPEPTDDDAPDAPPRSDEANARGLAEVDDDRPEIRMGADLHRAVDQVVIALPRDPSIYQRDGALVRVVRVTDVEAELEHAVRVASGTPQIRAMPIATLRERITRVTRCFRYDRRSEAWRPSIPTDPVVAAVISRGEWLGIPPIVGVIDTPSMRPDGTLIDVSGYDPATGYLYAPQRVFPSVRPCPTIEDARAALAALAEPWADFPFRSDADRYVPVAALLTLVARPAIRGACPAFAFDASTKGSGKTLLARSVTTLAHGREAALVSWPSDESELEKMLGAYALRGAGVIVFDNITTAFRGGPLDKVLTCADRVELRILGQSAVPSLSWRATVFVTGNNLVIAGDTTRRTLVSRLEPDCERPEERTEFTINSELTQWCRAHHPRLVVAALTLLRAYVLARESDPSCAPTLPGWGSFEAWRDLVASALAWAGAPDVMATRPTIAGDDDDDTAALRVLIGALPRLAPDGCTVRFMLGTLYPADRMRGDAEPDSYDDLRAALETLAPPQRPGVPPAAQRLGTAIGKYRRRVVGGRYLDRDTEHGGAARWSVRELVTR